MPILPTRNPSVVGRRERYDPLKDSPGLDYNVSIFFCCVDITAKQSVWKIQLHRLEEVQRLWVAEGDAGETPGNSDCPSELVDTRQLWSSHWVSREEKIAARVFSIELYYYALEETKQSVLITVDFHCIQHQLFLFLQPLPGKQLARYFDQRSDEFLDERERGLDRFLKRLATHPYFSFDRHLKVFITAEPEVCITSYMAYHLPLPLFRSLRHL